MKCIQPERTPNKLNICLRSKLVGLAWDNHLLGLRLQKYNKVLKANRFTCGKYIQTNPTGQHISKKQTDIQTVMNLIHSWQR